MEKIEEEKKQDEVMNAFDNYCQNLLNKFKQDPQYELKQEFGKMLMRHIDSFTPAELKRYNELKQILDERK